MPVETLKSHSDAFFVSDFQGVAVLALLALPIGLSLCLERCPIVNFNLLEVFGQRLSLHSSPVRQDFDLVSDLVSAAIDD